MDAIAISNAKPTATFQPERSVREARLWTRALLTLLTLGTLTGPIGLLLTLEVFVGVTGRSLSEASTLLVAAFFPLMFLSAYCMDKLRECENPNLA